LRERFAPPRLPCRTHLASQPTARTHTDSRLPRGAQVRISTINCTEAYPITDLISWAHPESKYKNHLFADKERNIDTRHLQGGVHRPLRGQGGQTLGVP